MIDYEEVINDMKKADKETLKRIIFELEQAVISDIKKCSIDDDSKKCLLQACMTRSYFEMLLVNAFVE